jgi:potassium/hydrogen antiporter
VALMVLARPIAAFICLLPFRFPIHEIGFIGWMGMRGAVPIVLALFPLLAGLPRANLLFHIAFFTVLLSLLLQGGTLPLAARLAGVGRPRSSAPLSSATLEGSEPPREVVQFAVAPGSHVARSALEDIEWPQGVRIVEIGREGRAIEPDTLHANDVVSVVTPVKAIAELEDMFGPPPAAGELALAPNATLGELTDYYGVPLPADAAANTLLTDFMQRRLRGRAAAGDRVEIGSLTLSVRQAIAGEVRRVGLRL